MVRGMSAAAIAAATAGPSLSDVINAAGLAFSDAAGGASGALWGAGLLAAAGALRGTDGNGQDPAQSAVSSAAVQRAVRAALEAVVQLGRATRGDKTLVDALEPFVEAFDAADAVPVAEAWRTAAAVARRAAADTADLAATRGRAALHGARSRGFPDPGAVSLATALVAAGDSFGDACGAPLPA
jgi:dihydroxyacetone kinase